MNNTGRKYKLLKDIACPMFTINKGEVFTKTGSAIDSKDGAYTYGSNGMYPLHPDTVEDNPEWFEEVKPAPPLDWEILSFGRVCEDDATWFLDTDSFYENRKSKGRGWSLYNLMEEDNNYSVKSGKGRIFSVKRLSDGQTFCVGDKVTHYCYPLDSKPIIRFEIKENRMRVYHSETNYSHLQNISPFPAPTSSHLPLKEDKTEVGCLRKTNHFGIKEFWYEFVVIGKEIDKEKYSTIKQAIERVLNNEEVNNVQIIAEHGKGLFYIWVEVPFDKTGVKINGEKFHSQDELLEAESRAFYSARETKDAEQIRWEFIKDAGTMWAENIKYPTFAYYKQVKKP